VKCLDHDEIARESENVRKALAARGYAHLQGVHTFEWFEALAASLGTIKLRTDVKSDQARDAEQRRTRSVALERPSVYASGELDFHTDNPWWNVLGWYCAEQDEDTGSSLLLDLADVAGSFTSEQLAALCQVRVYLPVRDANWQETAIEVSLLSESPDGYAVYWVPWLVVESSKAAHAALLNCFRDWLRRKEETELIELRLQPGEGLLIHNNRMLHGRRKLSSDTRRHLIRLAVSTGDSSAPR
jgi:hypothetical protein